MSHVAITAAGRGFSGKKYEQMLATLSSPCLNSPLQKLPRTVGRGKRATAEWASVASTRAAATLPERHDVSAASWGRNRGTTFENAVNAPIKRRVPGATAIWHLKRVSDLHVYGVLICSLSISIRGRCTCATLSPLTIPVIAEQGRWMLQKPVLPQIALQLDTSRKLREPGHCNDGNACLGSSFLSEHQTTDRL